MRFGLLRALALVASLGGHVGCARSAAARAEGWYAARTPHIALETDDGRDRALAMAARFARLHRDLSAVFSRCPHGAQHQTIAVTVLSRDDELDALRPRVVGFAMSARGGIALIASRIVMRGAVVGNIESQQYFAHELTHAFVRACFPDAPMWLHEGLATVFETVTIRDDHVIAGSPSYLLTDESFEDELWRGGHAVRVVPRAFAPLPTTLVHMRVEDFYMPAPTGARPALVARSGNYAASWALTHMLALGPDDDLRRRFMRYLSSIEAGGTERRTSFDDAFTGVDLDVRVTAYARAGRFMEIERPWQEPSDALAEVEPISSDAAHLRIAELLLAVLGPRALRDADPHLRLVVGSAEGRARALVLRAGFEPEHAEGYVSEAAALAPDALDVLRAQTLLAERAHDTERALSIATRLADRDDVRAADLVAVAAAERHAGHADDALMHATTAVHWEPGAWWAWYEVGRAAFDLARFDLARRAMRLVATFAGHGSSAAAQGATRWLARIDEAEREQLAQPLPPPPTELGPRP